MPVFLNRLLGILALGLILVSGMILTFGLPQAGDPPPPVRPTASRQPPAPLGVTYSWEQLGSLFEAPGTPRPRSAPAATPVPAPTPKPVPPPTDPRALRFIGTVEGPDGTRKFLFKHVPSGTYLALAAGTTVQGWSLAVLGDRAFVIDGPGGHYEIAR